MDSLQFMEALKSNDLNKLKEIPKSDIHNHATRGGNILDVLNE